MTLAERVARRIQSMPRLATVPPAVIEDVLAHGLQAMADMVPMETLASEVTTIDFDACEGCGHLIDPDHPEGAVKGGEDCIWLCDACIVEGGGTAAPAEEPYQFPVGDLPSAPAEEEKCPVCGGDPGLYLATRGKRCPRCHGTGRAPSRGEVG